MNDYERGFHDASLLAFECLTNTLFGEFREKTQITVRPEAIQESIGEIQNKLEDYLKMKGITGD